MSSEDWNKEFTEIVRRGAGASETAAQAPSEPMHDSGTPVSDADPVQVVAVRRAAIAATLVRLGFLAADRATLDNPAVEVLSELLPLDSELSICLTCHGFSSKGAYPFAETTGVFADRWSFRGSPAVAHVSPGEPPLLTVPRRELVVCTQDALSWTASRVRSDREDTVTLYSVPFSGIVGATVRQRHRGVVEVWLNDGPALTFRVMPEAVDALQACLDQAAQSH